MATSDFTLTSHARPLDCLEHDIALYPRVGLDQARCLHDLLRIGGSHHNLSQNRVGIERDGRDQRLDFFRFERSRRSIGLLPPRTANAGEDASNGPCPNPSESSHAAERHGFLLTRRRATATLTPSLLFYRFLVGNLQWNFGPMHKKREVSFAIHRHPAQGQDGDGWPQRDDVG